MIEILVFSTVSIFLYHIGIGIFFFLIPLQVIFARKGSKAFLISLGITFGLIIVIKLITLARAEDVYLKPFILIEIFTVFILLAGLLVVNMKADIPLIARAPRRIYILLAAALFSGVLCIPLILYLKGNEHFIMGIDEIFDTMSAYLNSIFSRIETGEVSSMKPYFQVNELKNISRDIFFRSFLFYYFILVTFSWWLGSQLGARSIRDKAGITKLIDFQLTDINIWILIISLALIILTFFVKLGSFSYLVWNVFLIFIFLYGLAGIGIIKFLFNRYNLTRGIKLLIITTLIILGLTPRINIIVLILVPGLGISEIWIKYRKQERRKNQT